MALQDSAADELGPFQPVLGLFQRWGDPVDPLNFAALDALLPAPGRRPKSVFQIYGLGDNFAPPVTLANYALAGGFAIVTADDSVDQPDPIGQLIEHPTPFGGNVNGNDRKYPLTVREYAPPAGHDGHLVAFDVANANADLAGFLVALAAHQVPQVEQ